MVSSMTFFSFIQWLFFIFANTVVVPISIGAVFQLPMDTVAMMLRSSLLFTGVACILQGLMGHRYPLMEGHSGLLWGVILNLGLSASSLGMDYVQIGGGIATGILLAGLVTIFTAVFNLVGFVQKIFSPMVTTVYLFLLPFELVFVFFKGMFQVTENGSMDIPISLLSLGIVILVSVLKIKGNQIVSNFSLLIGIVVGWGLYALLFPGELGRVESSQFSFSLFPLGKPNLELGIIAVVFFAGIMNMSNTIASIHAAADLLKEKAEQKQFKKSFYYGHIWIDCSSIWTGALHAVYFIHWLFAKHSYFSKRTVFYRRRTVNADGPYSSVWRLLIYYAGYYWECCIICCLFTAVWNSL